MRLHHLALVVVTSGVTAVAHLTAQTSPESPVRILMLGTGSPVPDPKAFGPATAITVGSRIFLVDAGLE